MKESIRQFAHEIFESELVDKLEAISVNDDHIDIQPASREMYTNVRRLVNSVGRGLEMDRADFHTISIKEHIPTVKLELTKEEVGIIYAYKGLIGVELANKLEDLHNNFDRYAE